MKTSIWDSSFQHISDALRHRLEIYTPAQLASRVGISKRAVLAAIKSGRLKAHRVNRRVFHIESREAAVWWQSLAE